MKDRLKELRKSLGITQEEFASRIGIKRNTIANYEIGRNEPIDAVLSLICREFNVSMEWLKFGTGNPSLPLPQDNLVVAAARLLGDGDPLFESFVEVYSELSNSDRDVLLRIGQRFFESLNDKTTMSNSGNSDNEICE